VLIEKNRKKMNTLNSLSEAKKYVDSFSRPAGYNNYAWDITKKLAIEAWDSYLSGRPFQRRINYLCAEFYRMIQNPASGEYIIPRHTFRMLTNA
jgi:hypothetical protein